MKWTKDYITKEVDVELDKYDIIEFLENCSESVKNEIKESLFSKELVAETDFEFVVTVPNLTARIEFEEFYKEFKKRHFI